MVLALKVLTRNVIPGKSRLHSILTPLAVGIDCNTTFLQLTTEAGSKLLSRNLLAQPCIINIIGTLSETFYFCLIQVEYIYREYINTM